MTTDRLTRPSIRQLALSLPLVILLAACGGGSASSAPGASASVTPVTNASASAAPASAASTPPTSATTGGVTVSANDASEAEIAAALEANGVPNAARWAREVAEYRPYPVDPTWAHLRQELAKYHPDPTVLEQIIATLEP